MGTRQWEQRETLTNMTHTCMSIGIKQKQNLTINHNNKRVNKQ